MPSPDWSDATEWSDEHVVRANRFATHAVFAWLALVTLNAALAPAGTLGFLLTGFAVLAATWLLAQSLFTQVDELVKTRFAEAGGGGTASSGSDAGSTAPSDG